MNKLTAKDINLCQRLTYNICYMYVFAHSAMYNKDKREMADAMYKLTK